ncbi:hypothetical protein GCM10010449_26480 [Streptomyces rectiviolaceus]|uniref:Uncharacterized protein n=1 Tax=Streptomyces rectiviolaceus TaxID=332591 RepID=A0ABP6MI50_9ACTN
MNWATHSSVSADQGRGPVGGGASAWGAEAGVGWGCVMAGPWKEKEKGKAKGQGRGQASELY